MSGRRKLHGNVYIYAFPFALLISSLSFIGFYTGYLLADRMDISFIALTTLLTFAGFAAGIALSVVLSSHLQHQLQNK
ncbi:MAG: hypothetical protein N2V77_03760 [Canidatus Methanoxibalbensis ujae]|nr:hypothetical protein [Candidatus Methanoxibalbensis ujae]MCW7078861.1 hypothetical protein [Candidatus Methanoxibalbensis ujae]